MEENKSTKTKGISIALILLAIVIGFGVVIGLTQTSGANNLKNKETEISKYAFDENGTLLSYSGDLTEITIPETYSLSPTVEEVQMTSSSLISLVQRANNLGVKEFKVEDQSGSYSDDWGNVFYQEKYVLTYNKRKTIEGTDYQVKSIGSSAFANNVKITAITIPNSVKTISNNAFSGCTKLQTVKLSNNLERIENSAFFNCNQLRDIELPNSITYIGSQAFQDCDRLTRINIPTSMYEISDMCFYNCDALTEVYIPSNIRYIYHQAFYYCRSLAKVTFEEGLEHINDMAFQNCRALTEIELPSTLIYLGNQAFYSCTLLKTVKLNSDMIPDMNNMAFTTAYVDKIYVRDEIFDEIRNYGNWSRYSAKFVRMSELATDETI